MGLISEFKTFAMRGNVIDLAVGVIIGGAFGKIISSLVDDVITPLLLKPLLDAASLSNIGELKWGTVKYGSFLSSVIGFLMIAFVIFLLIKFINAVQKRSVAGAPPPPTNEEVLLTQIRDLLKEKK